MQPNILKPKESPATMRRDVSAGQGQGPLLKTTARATTGSVARPRTTASGKMQMRPRQNTEETPGKPSSAFAQLDVMSPPCPSHFATQLWPSSRGADQWRCAEGSACNTDSAFISTDGSTASLTGSAESGMGMRGGRSESVSLSSSD